MRIIGEISGLNTLNIYKNLVLEGEGELNLMQNHLTGMMKHSFLCIVNFQPFTMVFCRCMGPDKQCRC